MKRQLLLFTAVACIFIGCEKDSPSADDQDMGAPSDPATVAKTNSGFTHVFDDVQLITSATAAAPTMGIADFTVETNDNLNLVYYKMTPLQQSDMYEYMRITKNLKTGALIPLPQYADDLKTFSVFTIKSAQKSILLQTFRPYSNFYTYAVYGRQQFSNSILYGGDFDLEMSQANPIGTPDMGFYYPVMNMEGVSLLNNGFAHFSLGVPSPNYLASLCNPISFTTSNTTGKFIMKMFLESRYTAQGNSVAISTRTDSVMAYTVNINAVAQRTLTDKIAISGFVPANNISTLRHYSTDGKKMGILIKDDATQKYWTFAYDFNTGKLSSGLTNVSLEYSGTGSDIDLDEAGNIYYTGTAGKGTNDKGVSIYKKSADGVISIVGSDDFLKFGEIVKLRLLMDKVYIAVKGKKTGTDYYQLSILKQN